MNKALLEKLNRSDRLLIIVILILALAGIIMVFSASYLMSYNRFAAPYGFVYKQLMWNIFGAACFILTFYTRVDVIKKSARWFYLLGIVALVGVLIFGKEMNGARRWFSFGFITFQPSEAMKLIMIIFISDYLDRKKSRLKSWSGFWRLMFFIALPSGLVLLQPDLGGALVIAVISLAICFLGGIDMKYIVTILCAVVVVAVFAVVTTPYRMARVKKYLLSASRAPLISYVLHNRGSDVRQSLAKTDNSSVSSDGSDELSPYKIGTQADASIAAIKRGGWFGVGIGNGCLKMSYLPEPHTDFIFAVIGEEWGFAGAMFIVALFVLLLARTMRVASSVGDCFMSLAASGIGVYFTIQSLFHIGVSCGLLPTKGLTLPFISFGGSSLLVSFVTAGFLLNISSRAEI